MGFALFCFALFCFVLLLSVRSAFPFVFIRMMTSLLQSLLKIQNCFAVFFSSFPQSRIFPALFKIRNYHQTRRKHVGSDTEFCKNDANTLKSLPPLILVHDCGWFCGHVPESLKTAFMTYVWHRLMKVGHFFNLKIGREIC